MQLTVIPLKAKRQNGNFILFDEISKTLSENSITLQNGDVIVISSKYVARSQGRILDTKSVIDSENANQISKKFKMKPKFAEIVLRESDKVFGGVSGFIITSSDNVNFSCFKPCSCNCFGNKCLLAICIFSSIV